MLVGMGTVFAFLTVLVVSTVLMSWIVRRLLPDPIPTSVDPASGAVPDELLAVIGAAVAAYRKRTEDRRSS